SANVIVMPVNVAGSHWIAAAIKLELGTVTLYDSLYASFKSYHEDVFWVCFMLVSSKSSMWRYVIDFSGGDSDFHNGVQVPQQENDFDCGLFALSYIRSLAQGGEVKFAFDKSQFDSVRRRMVWELAKNTLLEGL
ncbi:hypothetical protein GYMLUDRAFT_183476, partial [Collybiopsis luxurians FD-317 M1]